MVNPKAVATVHRCIAIIALHQNHQNSTRPHQNGIETMPFEKQNKRSRALEVWNWESELNAAVTDRNAERDMDAFLGFTGDGDSDADPTVSIRTKIPHQQQPTRCHLSFQ